MQTSITALIIYVFFLSRYSATTTPSFALGLRGLHSVTLFSLHIVIFAIFQVDGGLKHSQIQERVIPFVDDPCPLFPHLHRLLSPVS